MRSVGWSAVVGTVFGALGGLVWWWLTGPDGVCRTGDDESCLGHLFLVPTVGLPVALALSWIVLALLTNRWMAPVITIGGSAVATYTLGLVARVTGDDPAVAVIAAVWGLGYGLVALACRPGLSRPVRGALIGVLLLPALVYLIG